MLKEAHRCQRKDEMWDDDWFYYHRVFLEREPERKPRRKEEEAAREGEMFAWRRSLFPGGGSQRSCRLVPRGENQRCLKRV